VSGIRENEITAYYQTYFSENQDGNADYRLDEACHRKNARELIGRAASFANLRNADVLEVGCAYGFLLDEAGRRFGCRPFGAEINPEAAGFAEKEFAITLLDPSSFAENREGFFDAAFLIGTLEHVPDPRKLLGSLFKCLKPGGILVLTTIDTAGPLPVYAVKPPEHLHYFNRKNLGLLLRQTGFEIRSIKMWTPRYSAHRFLRLLAGLLRFKRWVPLSEVIRKKNPELSFRVPSNEQLVIAQKR